MNKYMVIERFFADCREKIYTRLAESGRMLPDGLFYIDSWLEHDGNRCFQLMETDDPALFESWTKNWEDLGSFEIIELGPRPDQPNSDA